MLKLLKENSNVTVKDVNGNDITAKMRKMIVESDESQERHTIEISEAEVVRAKEIVLNHNHNQTAPNHSQTILNARSKNLAYNGSCLIDIKTNKQVTYGAVGKLLEGGITVSISDTTSKTDITETLLPKIVAYNKSFSDLFHWKVAATEAP